MLLNLAFTNSTVVDPGLYKNNLLEISKKEEVFERVEPHSYMGIIGRSDKMEKVFRLIKKISNSDSTILISGKSGTGKELVARAVHQSSHRRNKPFIPINCGAIPENLLESELFGHVRGAFTGATAQKTGKFEQANGGTLFLDEIGDMSPDLQVKVLRVLEEREFERVGGIKSIKVDVRIVAATHRNLAKEVKKGNFREDLFYRLYVIPVKLPALNERTSDIPLLVDYYINFFNKQNNANLEGITDETMNLMVNYSWPGNIRELKNIIERLVVIKGEGRIVPSDLPDNIKIKNDKVIRTSIEISKEGISLNSAVNEFEKALIFQSLEKTKWVKNKAAKLLQLNRTTLVEKIKRHHLKPQQLKQCPMFE